MKLNFIKNLSDEMVRENHSLKNEIIQLKQKAKNSQEQMINFINQMFPQKNILTSPDPEQILRQFKRQIKQLLINNSAKLIKIQKMQSQIQELRQQRETIRQEVLNKQNQNIEYCKKWQFQKQTLNFKIQRLQEEFNVLQVKYNSLQFTIQNLKKQIVVLQEKKQAEIEQIKIKFNRQLIDQREKAQLQYLKLEKKYIQQIQSKQKTIKDLGSNLLKLKNNLDEEDGAGIIMEKMYNSFQQYSTSSKKIQELQSQFNLLREQKMRLYNQNINLESKMSEFKAIQFNLMNINNRLKIEKGEIQNKLVEKIKEMNKSQKDKQAMELYYDQKWNSQYKKVKNRLQKVFEQKIQVVQQEFKRKVDEMNIKINQANQKRNAAEQRSQILREIVQKDRKEKQNLHVQILQREKKINQLNNSSIQCWQMFQEDILCIKVVHTQRILLQQKLNNKLQAQVLIQRQKLVQQHLQHCKKVSELQKIAELQLQKQLIQFQKNKQNLHQKHIAQINDLNNKILKEQQIVKQIKQSMQKQLQFQIHSKQINFNNQLKQIYQQSRKREQKWLDKYKQMESVISLMKNKNEEDKLNHRKQMVVWQRQHQALSKRIDQLIQQSQQLRRIKDGYHLQLGKLQLHLVDKQNDIQVRDRKILQLEANLDLSKKQIETLITNRKHWQKQLISLQEKFKLEFQQLLNHNEQQKNIYKLKISQLEQLNKKRIISQKDYEKMQSLKNQKKELKDQMHIKQAENIILTQVKSYYQTKLKDAQFVISKNQFKNTHSILARKLKKKRINNNISEISQRVFEPMQIQEKKTYFPATTRKSYNFSSTKSKFQKSQDKYRFPSSMS